MPSSMHPQAKFDPLPPDLDLITLVETTPNFDYVARISVEQIRKLGMDEFEKVILHHVIIGGKPLVVDGWEADLPPWLFSPTWLIENVGTKHETVRDIGQSTNMSMTIGHYIKNMNQLTRSMTPKSFRDPKRQRLYLKDIDCPQAWYDKLEELIPQQLFYYNDSVGEKSGIGAVKKRNSFGQMVLGKGAALAGDLMSSLPKEMRAENFMCYIGHEGTYTPAHREMCASLGHNIMVEASDRSNGEVPGSSIWFMTESKDREVVSEFFLSMLGHDIEIETHFAQINAWKKAPFPVYIVEQKVGDFILIPPLAPHQVWNRGTRTMKAAWNRTTVETLELAISEALPRARLVCRDEQYKNKAIIYYTLQKYSDLLERVEAQEGHVQYDEYGRRASQDAGRVKQLQRDFRRLYDLLTTVMISEMFDTVRPERKVEFIKYDSNVTCSYCRCNIFNRFLTCRACIIRSDDGAIEDTYDVCLECYAMGRSCTCISNLSWVEQWKWPELTADHEKWRARVISILTSQAIDGQIVPEIVPQPLNVVRRRSSKTPVAQICQEQLRLRPFRDPSRLYVPEPLPGDSDNEPEVDDKGSLVKKKMTKREFEQRKKSHHSCHICRKAEENWKLAFCSECSLAYCYGVLYRAFDLMPQSVMEDAEWKCPKCLKICSCGACRKDRRQKPYQPKGTLLGHDTKKVADIRSIEILVDFSRTNIGWLREESNNDPQSSQRMQKLVSKAIEEKARGDDLEDANDPQHSNGASGQIDPRLGGGDVAPMTPTYANTHEDADLVRSSPKYDRYGSNGHAEHDETYRPLYPEPPELGRERVMGAGYYLQQSGPEAILYNDPETGSLDEQNSPNTGYPELPAKEPEIVYNKAKRKRPSIAKFTSRSSVNAHSEYVQAQKKQKLADAKANSNSFTTQNQLEGGDTLIIKFPAPKGFLQGLRTKSAKNTRSTRASLRAEAAENKKEIKVVDGPNAIRSDVQPAFVDSDGEFDLSLQSMDNYKSSMNTESSRRNSSGTVKRSGRKVHGTRGITKKSLPRQRRGSAEEVELQILNKATARHGTGSPHSQSDVDEHDTSLRRRSRPKSALKSPAQGHENLQDDSVYSVSIGKVKRQRYHAKSSTDEEEEEEEEYNLEDEQIDKIARRAAGKRPSRAPASTQPVVDDEEEYLSGSKGQIAQPAPRSSGVLVHPPSDSDEVLEVIEEPAPKKHRRSGRPPRQTKSFEGVMPEAEGQPPKVSNSPGKPSRRKPAPVAQMAVDEEEDDNDEIPETQYTNGLMSLNRRDISERLPSLAARDSSASSDQQSMRFEVTLGDEQRLESPPRRFATFDDGGSHSSPDPIDYSVFDDDFEIILVDHDDINGSTAPRDNQRIDKDGDTEMDVQNSTIVAVVEKTINSGESAPKPKAEKQTAIVIGGSDGANLPAVISDRKLSKTVSQEKPPSPIVEPDYEDHALPRGDLDDENSPTPDLEPMPTSISTQASSSVIQEDTESDVDTIGETRYPTPGLSRSAKSVGKQKAPAASPVKVMTEEERISEENRRAKQAILAGLDYDSYYSSDYYSASEEEQEEAEPQSADLTGKSKAMPTVTVEDDEEEVNLVSPYFPKSQETNTIVRLEPSVTASKTDQRRKPRSVKNSSVTTKSGKNTSMLSLAEKRALAGQKTKFTVLPVDEVVKDKFGNLLKKGDNSGKASPSKVASISRPRSELKRVPGIFGAASTRKYTIGSTGEHGVNATRDSDGDESDTSIPAVRPSVKGRAQRGESMGMLDRSRGRGARSHRSRQRPRKSDV